ncbi:MAG: hypothetical protein IPL80_19850 [Sterolibacteriaceae bacterium]|nr:hypothetical protein [Sterolibacteriaceae bacterium]
MTSPRHAEATTKGRYYRHPVTGQTLVSVTNVLSSAIAKPALVGWAAKIVAEHALDNLPTVVARSRTDRDGTLRDLKGQVRIARDKAADLGSRVHHLAEAHVLGKPVATQPGDEDARPFVVQYERFLAAFGVDLARDIIASEMTVANPDRGYAGTLDLILTLPIGWDPAENKTYARDAGERSEWMVDLKTSLTRPATSVYGEYALQLAGLRAAREMWLPDGTTCPMQGTSGAAILNLRPTTWELIPLPIRDAERDAFLAAVTVCQWLHDTGTDIGNGSYWPTTPAGRMKPKRTTTSKAA